jgi:hypothetical protein
MPYIDKTPIESVEDAIDLWKGVITDPNIDGYNGFACMKKIYRAKWKAEQALKNIPNYHGAEEWIEENRPK